MDENKLIIGLFIISIFLIVFGLVNKNDAPFRSFLVFITGCISALLSGLMTLAMFMNI